MELYSGDFNHDDKYDMLFSRSDYPLHDYVSLKKYFKNSIWTDYTKPSEFNAATTSELLSKVDADITCYKVNQLAHVMLLNNGRGDFEIKEMPTNMQFSVVYGIVVGDFNHDGHIDIVSHGNQSKASPVFQPQLNGRGTLLLNDGRAKFEYIENVKSGFVSDANGRGLGIVNGPKNKKLMIAVNNNAPAKLFEIQNSDAIQSFLEFNENESHAVFKFKSGGIQKIENYIGGSYLTQKFQYYPITDEVSVVDVYNGDILVRSIKQ